LLHQADRVICRLRIIAHPETARPAAAKPGHADFQSGFSKRGVFHLLLNPPAIFSDDLNRLNNFLLPIHPHPEHGAGRPQLTESRETAADPNFSAFELVDPSAQLEGLPERRRLYVRHG